MVILHITVSDYACGLVMCQLAYFCSYVYVCQFVTKRQQLKEKYCKILLIRLTRTKQCRIIKYFELSYGT